MKRISTKIKAVILATLLLTSVLPVDVKAVSINIVSDTSWTVSDANGDPLPSNAQNVCLNATTPSNCPTGATLYGYTRVGWIANLSSIPGATWIWAPDITGSTSSAANAEFTFQKEFYLCGAPQGGTISVAADDSAEVFINGAPMPVLTSSSHSMLSSATILASNFVQGLNIIQVKVKNGLNPSDCGAGEYRCNPAGFVLGASFADALNAWPTCTSNGKTFTVGQFETLSCPAGQTGSKTRPCVCIGSNGIWGPTSSTCTTPPTTCTGNNGITFGVGDKETLSCPTGLTGSAFRTCQANGSWSSTDSSACVPPPSTCTATNGTTVSQGATENRPCTAPKIGADTFTCGSNGTWALTSSTCNLPVCSGPDCVCGSSEGDLAGVYTATCPSGTECKARTSMSGNRTLWCAIFGIDCPQRLVSTDWYCDP